MNDLAALNQVIIERFQDLYAKLDQLKAAQATQAQKLADTQLKLNDAISRIGDLQNRNSEAIKRLHEAEREYVTDQLDDLKQAVADLRLAHANLASLSKSINSRLDAFDTPEAIELALTKSAVFKLIREKGWA